MSDTELTIVIMIFTVVIMGLGAWIGSQELVSEVGNTTMKTDREIEISRRKTASIIGKIMMVIFVLLLSRPYTYRVIDKIFTGQQSLTLEIISIFSMGLLWIVVGSLLIMYGKKDVK